MKTIFAVIGFVVVALVIGTCVACNDDDKSNSLGTTQLVSHRYDDGDCYKYGDCGDDEGGDYGGYHGDQGGGGNGNRGRRGDNQRGDKNCHSFCGNTIVIPTPPGMGGGQQPPQGKDERP